MFGSNPANTKVSKRTISVKYLSGKKIIFFILLSILSASCSQDSDTQQTGEAPALPEVEADEQTLMEEPTSEEPGALGGTSWRLVQIMSMDDNTFKPDDPSKYTLSFRTDGGMNVLADCNRGKGSWTSESRSQLKFGPIATTMAMCPPESLHDRYLAQFEWVRSYVIRDGHLFLATLADGSIIEFEPADDN